MMRLKFAVCILFAAFASVGFVSRTLVSPVRADSPKGFTQLAAATVAQPPEDDDNRTPEERMRDRFPQPVVVGSLIGLPVQDWQDQIIGYVREVVRTPEGKIQLIVPYGDWFGWVPYGGLFDLGRRPVAVPIEVVAILAKHLNSLDMGVEDYQAAPTWTADQGAPIARGEIIQIAIARR